MKTIHHKKIYFFSIWLCALLFLWIPYIFSYFAFIDEAGLFASAIQLAKGKLIYKDVFEPKGPFLLWIYLLMVKISATHYTLILHLTLLCLIILNSFLIYKILLKDIKREFAFIAFLYPFFLACFYPGNMAGSREPFFTFFILITFYLLLYFSHKNKLVFLAGIIAGSTLLFKPFSIFSILSCGFLSYYYTKVRLKPLIFFIASSIVPVFFIFYLFHKGLLSDFWLWNVKYAIFISKTIPLWRKIYHTLAMLGRLLLFNPVYLMFGIPVIFNKSLFLKNIDIVLLFFSTLLWAIMHGLPFPHYYIPLIPFIFLLSVKGFYNFHQIYTFGKVKKYFYLLILLSISQSLLHWNGIDFHKQWIRFIKEKKWEARYEKNKDIELINYIQENVPQNEKIVLWGLNPRIYIFSEREPGTRFISSVEPVNGFVYYDIRKIIQFPEAEQLFLYDLESNKVKYFIDVTNKSLLNMGYYTIDKYPAIAKYLYENFILIGNINGCYIWKRSSYE
ncbi:MAG: hypothetical protein N3D17_01640 [bacterium]|nr:hypothetical protein [bacterium]